MSKLELLYYLMILTPQECKVSIKLKLRVLLNWTAFLTKSVKLATLQT
jgi:hypothetical protein